VAVQLWPEKQPTKNPPVPPPETNALWPKTDRRVLVEPSVFDVASTWPVDPSACTARYGSSLWAWITVSNPPFGTTPIEESRFGSEPPSTCQEPTVVAPFQLA